MHRRDALREFLRPNVGVAGHHDDFDMRIKRANIFRNINAAIVGRQIDVNKRYRKRAIFYHPLPRRLDGLAALLTQREFERLR